MLGFRTIRLNGRPRRALLAFLFPVHPIVGFAEEGGQIFNQRLPERADGSIDAVADKSFPELVHLVGKVLLPDGAAQHHELIAADAVSFAGEDFVQGVGGAADEGHPRPRGRSGRCSA